MDIVWQFSAHWNFHDISRLSLTSTEILLAQRLLRSTRRWHMQLKGNQTARRPQLICWGCAVRHHDFREVSGPGLGNEKISSVAPSEAWIDGRPYRLLHTHGAERPTCSECGSSVPNVYAPIRKGEEDTCVTDGVVISLARWAGIHRAREATQLD
jgi:hypothetical protein